METLEAGQPPPIFRTLFDLFDKMSSERVMGRSTGLSKVNISSSRTVQCWDLLSTYVPSVRSAAGLAQRVCKISSELLILIESVPLQNHHQHHHHYHPPSKPSRSPRPSPSISPFKTITTGKGEGGLVPCVVSRPQIHPFYSSISLTPQHPTCSA